MCGRYTLYDISKSKLKIANNLIGKNYNITPASVVPVLVGNNKIKSVVWTFKVSWAKKLSIINARSETLESKAIFKNSKRCIFIANGYFEWLRWGKVKKPYYHTFKDQMMYFGGIFNDEGACIVTRKSYSMDVNVHHRQPVILRYGDFERWFSFEHDYNCDHSRKMKIFEVSPQVNSPKNNAPSNIERL